MEAALHVLPESSGRTPAAAAAAAALGALTSSERIERASTLCLHAAAVLPILAEVAAARLAPALQHTAGSAAGTAAGKAAWVQQAAATTGASAANNSDSSKLQQKMFCCFVAGVKYAQFSANLTRSAGPLDAEVLDCYSRSVTLLVTISAAAVKMLGEASAGLSQLSAEKQLLWFQVLACWVVDAGQLLQHIPQLVAFGGGLAPGQPSLFSGFAAAMGLCVMTLQSMLQEDRAAAAAVEAGLPAAAATPEDLARLRLTACRCCWHPSSGPSAVAAQTGRVEMWQHPCSTCWQPVRRAACPSSCTALAQAVLQHSLSVAAAATLPAPTLTSSLREHLPARAAPAATR
jgi:hypothetical protein